MVLTTIFMFPLPSVQSFVFFAWEYDYVTFVVKLVRGSTSFLYKVAI